MALDPGVMAILQARRQFATRAPAAPGIVTDPMEPPDPVVTPPAPVAVPAPPPEAKALARASRMRNYMQANGMTPITYGANNERRGNLPVGSGLPGGVDMPTGGKPAQAPAPVKQGKPQGAAYNTQYSGPPIPGMPLSNNASNLTLGNAPGTPKRFGGI